METLLRDMLGKLDTISEQMDELACEMAQSREHQKKETSRQELFYHRVISLEASLDHKFNVFGERQEVMPESIK